MLDKISLGLSTFLAGMFTTSLIVRLEHTEIGAWQFPAILLGLTAVSIVLRLVMKVKE